MISTCGRDENNKYTGGKAGDQTGQEWYIRAWYNSPWDMILRHPNAEVRNLIAELSEEAANNNKIGYDQNQRLTFWNQLAKSGYRPKNITTECECDCSAGVCGVVKAAGCLLNNTAIKNNISESGWTGVMKNMFIKAGFQVLTDSKYRTSDNYLLRGDILLNEATHAAINITNGSNSGELNSSTNPTNNNIAVENHKETITKMQTAKYYDKSAKGGIRYNTTKKLNLRYGAGVAQTSILVMPKNGVVIWYGYYNIAPNGKKWYYVAYNGKVGYCSSTYLKKV